MDIQREEVRAFERYIKSTYPQGEQLAKDSGKTLCELYSSEWSAWQAAKAPEVKKINILLCKEHIKGCESHGGVFNTFYPDEEPCIMCLIQSERTKANAVPKDSVIVSKWTLALAMNSIEDDEDNEGIIETLQELINEAQVPSLESKFPNIYRAAKEIWYDNGMINRLEPIEEKIEQLSAWLKTLDADDLAEYDEKLNLTDDDLSEVCCGEETAAYQILQDQAVHDFVGRIFNEEYKAKTQEPSDD